MANVLNIVAPSFIGITYLQQALEMKDSLERLQAKFDLPDNYKENEDTFLALLPQLIDQFPLYIDSPAPDADVESAFYSIISMIQLLGQVAQMEEMSKRFSNSVFNNGNAERVQLKRRLLSYQVNCYEPLLPSTYTLLMNLLKLVKETGNGSFVNLQPTQYEEWVVKWKLDLPEQREIFRLLHDALTVVGKGESAIHALVHLLKLYSKNEAAEAKADAHQCIVSCIAHPQVFVVDHLLDLHPISALEGQLIHDLLEIFVSGNLSDYIEFYDNNREFAEKLALSHEENMRKMRLLTLASMAQDNSEITYDELIDKLNLEKDEVEPFVIEAIGSQLIRGKINEPEDKIVVSSTINRTFGDAEWHLIKNKLEVWQRNLLSIQECMKKGIHYQMPIGAG